MNALRGCQGVNGGSESFNRSYGESAARSEAENQSRKGKQDQHPSCRLLPSSGSGTVEGNEDSLISGAVQGKPRNERQRDKSVNDKDPWQKLVGSFISSQTPSGKTILAQAVERKRTEKSMKSDRESNHGMKSEDLQDDVPTNEWCDLG